MSNSAYPIDLPCPQTSTVTPAERRALSDTARPRDARALARDRLEVEKIVFPPMTPAQYAAFRAWWRDDIILGGAWFVADWPLPRGMVDAVRKFIGAPMWTFVPGGFWRITAVCQVRGRGELPLAYIPSHVCVEGPVWTQSVMPDIRYHAITYGNGMFVAGGGDASDNAPLATSSNGITWALRTGPTFTGPSPIRTNCLAFGNGVFVTAGSFIELAWSLDALTWGVLPLSCEKTMIYFGGGIFVLISVNDDQIRTSPDGQTWTARTLPASIQWSSGGYGGGRHIVIAGTVTAKSDDGGATWTAGGSLPVGYAGRIAYGNGVWVVLNSTLSNAVAYSLDGGDSWTALVIPGPAATLIAIHFQQGVFLMVDIVGQTVQTSTDGINWALSAHTLPGPFSGVGDYAFNGARRYAAIRTTNPGTTIGAWGEC